MAFGFVIERFGLFVHMLAPHPGMALQKNFSFWIGLAFILLGAVAAAASCMQYRTILRTLKPIEIPQGYRVYQGVLMNLAVAALGALLTIHLFTQGPG